MLYFDTAKGDALSGELAINKSGRILPVGQLKDGPAIVVDGPTFQEGTVCHRLDGLDTLPEYREGATWRILTPSEIIEESKRRLHTKNYQVLAWWLQTRGFLREIKSKRFNLCDSLTSCIDIQYDSGRLSSGVETTYRVETPSGSWEFSIRTG